MYICAVHIQVLQKSKTVCFTSCSKGTYVILPSEQRLWSSFPAEDGSSTVLSLTLAWSSTQKIEGEGGQTPCLPRKEVLCGPFGETLDWSRGKRSRTVKQTDGNKRLFWCEERSVLQLHKQMLLLDWHVDPTPAGDRYSLPLGQTHSSYTVCREWEELGEEGEKEPVGSFPSRIVSAFKNI